MTTILAVAVATLLAGLLHQYATLRDQDRLIARQRKRISALERILRARALRVMAVLPENVPEPLDPARMN